VTKAVRRDERQRRLRPVHGNLPMDPMLWGETTQMHQGRPLDSHFHAQMKAVGGSECLLSLVCHSGYGRYCRLWGSHEASPTERQ